MVYPIAPRQRGHRRKNSKYTVPAANTAKPGIATTSQGGPPAPKSIPSANRAKPEYATMLAMRLRLAMASRIVICGLTTIRLVYVSRFAKRSISAGIFSSFQELVDVVHDPVADKHCTGCQSIPVRAADDLGSFRAHRPGCGPAAPIEDMGNCYPACWANFGITSVASSSIERRQRSGRSQS